MSYRVILEIGEGLPTRVFGGDYDTREQAERARRNIEKSTHYKARIEPQPEPAEASDDRRSND